MTAGSHTVAIISLGGEKPTPKSNPGVFETQHCIQLAAAPDATPSAWLDAIAQAEQCGARWMIALPRGQALRDDAFDLVAPALDVYDAVFGSAHVAGGAEAVARLTRLAFDTPERLLHALLHWWMPDAHLVRTEVAAQAAGRVAKASRQWRLDYLFELWGDARCLKSAQPLLELAEDPQPLDKDGRDHVLRRLAQQPVFLPIVHGDAVYHLPYTGRNAGIEREQTRGLFFEAMELEELRKVVPPGARIVDVGANTGNHTVFFAGPMQAASVIPFEPLPDAGRALCAAVARNALQNVDLSWLGKAVSARPGRASPVFSGRGGLGATSLAPDPSGEIDVVTLDSMISGHVDLLKIDVEGMEMDVLAGASEIIARSRPLIFVEIANRNTGALMNWLQSAGYRVSRIFTDKGHANYLLAPET